MTGVRSVWPLSPGHSLVCEEKLKNEAVSSSWTNSRLNRFGYCLLWKWGIPWAWWCLLWNAAHLILRVSGLSALLLWVLRSRRTNINKRLITLRNLLWVTESSVSYARIMCLLPATMKQEQINSFECWVKLGYKLTVVWWELESFERDLFKGFPKKVVRKGTKARCSITVYRIWRSLLRECFMS